VNSELAVPVKSTGGLLGILNIDDIHPNAFDETDVRLMTTIADQLAIALENARAYESLQRSMSETHQRAEELAVLFKVSQAIADAPLNLEEIGLIIVRQFDGGVMGLRNAPFHCWNPMGNHCLPL
ncbi:MAG: GAF domain-containing protein, partial [Anaerolineae bacterium]|nr:GAF domain-containing protein [Anaerolineae bacterium]